MIYSVVNDQRSPIVTNTIGNELSESSIISTNAVYPDIIIFKDNYFVIDLNITATEAFIFTMADFART